MHAVLGSIWTEQIPDATAGQAANVCDLNSSGGSQSMIYIPL